jgi:anti-sigma B factor antagonist
MGLEIGRRDREGVVVLDMNGRITVGDEASRFREVMRELAKTPQPKVILNLKDVDYIDSTGLGAIVMCATTVRNAGGEVTLVNLNKRTIELLVMTKLSTIFDSFTDETDAVNSFFPGREVKKFDILAFVQSQKKL